MLINKKTCSQMKLYKELVWESLSERRKFRRLTLYYKILNDKTPPYLKYHIKPLKENSTNRYLNSYFPFCHIHWDSLSVDLKNVTPIGQFKSLYKKTYFLPKKSFFLVQVWIGIRFVLDFQKPQFF